ncbi:MAG: hypothetical protein R3C56_35985 [Pirellulaceae bacterium]
MVAHVGVLKQMDRVWLLPHASPSTIATHIDRYIIREDAVVSDVSQEYALFIVGDGIVEHVASQTEGLVSDGNASADHLTPVSANSLFEPSNLFAFACPLPIFGQRTLLLCCPAERAEQAIETLSANGSEFCTAERFEWLRISSFWPLHPSDIGDKTIPQELDRDQQAISFTKGCYLGQETIARLTRGQLQKKLCLIELSSTGEYVGDALTNGEKEVGHITSRAIQPVPFPRTSHLRRGNFAAGTRLTGNGFEAHVLP